MKKAKQIVIVDQKLGLAGINVAMRAIEFERAKRQDARLRRKLRPIGSAKKEVRT